MKRTAIQARQRTLEWQYSRWVQERNAPDHKSTTLDFETWLQEDRERSREVAIAIMRRLGIWTAD